MELNTQPLQGPVRPAASVVMLRDGQEGLEVFLLKRHGLSEVLGGVYVFPGGKVDPEDALLDLPAHLDLPPQTLHAALGEPELDLLEATALHVAALREAFEETGVLYAQGAGARQAALAWDLLRQGRSFDEVLQANVRPKNVWPDLIELVPPPARVGEQQVHHAIQGEHDEQAAGENLVTRWVDDEYLRRRGS